MSHADQAMFLIAAGLLAFVATHAMLSRGR